MLTLFGDIIRRKIAMPGQTKISSFFTSPNPNPSRKPEPEGQARKLKLNNNKDHDVEDGPLKKARVEVEGNSSCVSIQNENDPDAKMTKDSLTMEEKGRLENHRVAAKLKLLNSKSNGVITDVGLSWFTALENEFSKDYFKNLSTFVSSERQKGTVYPPANQTFTWTKACDIKDVKVVILGQDPYHGPKQAHGLCFSVLPGVRAPPSLENMYKELASDIEGFTKPGHGYLAGWATQGVLLLNACLTVKASQANSHAGKGWEKLTDAVIQWLNSHSQGLVFMLWGAYAQKKGACIDQKRHHILKSVHPSPLSAHRGFFGCKHFSKCNELLKAGGKKTIDWTYLPKDIVIE